MAWYCFSLSLINLHWQIQNVFFSRFEVEITTTVTQLIFVSIKFNNFVSMPVSAAVICAVCQNGHFPWQLF